jgi:DNA repair protein RecN (Recombination protein N)
MLIQLSIRNIILIESCDISLKSGLCVLSGETGAGKSILLDSLGLVLGARADNSLIRSGQEQGSVSAEFDISDNISAMQILTELDIEPSDTLIIRRSISSDGKSRALVNDQLVTVTALKRLAETLVELHGQHDQKTLHDTVLHRTMLTDYARLADVQRSVVASYLKWNSSRNAITEMLEEVERATREQDYLRHMRGELKILNPQLGEEEALTTARASMMQSEKMFEILNEAIAELNNGKGVLAALRNSQRTLTRSNIAANSQLFAPIIEGLEKAALEAEEAQYALEKIGQDSQFNPAKLEEIEERLFALKAAGRKYNLPVDELAMLREQVDEKLSIIDSQENKLKSLKAAEKEAKEEFHGQAKELSEQRRKAAKKLEAAIEKELAPLKMEGTRFRVRIDTLDETSWGASGIDFVQFECATNVTKGAKDIAYSSLSKIASGGELSRFMLAMKVALSSTNNIPTIIFDEIDTGTGGAVADAIGKRLAALGENSQVLVVTHLPQVAARGDQHLLIKKQEKNKKIITQVTELTGEQREEELARMLAGEVITSEARKAAQKLLEHAA